MKKENKKEILYIFLHNTKCAGTTMKKHIEQKFEKDEIMTTYFLQPFFNIKTKRFEYYDEQLEQLFNPKKPICRSNSKKPKRRLIEYLKSLTIEEKKKIKVIYGHEIFYGIHKFFPDRKLRYVIFVRSPLKRTISGYNFSIDQLSYFRDSVKAEDLPIKEAISKQLGKALVKKGNLLSFDEWLSSSYNIATFPAMASMTRFLYKRKFINKENPSKKDIKKCLDKFYFIGITKNYREDALFLYHLLEINKFYSSENISTKHFVLKDEDKATKKMLLEKNIFDQELYNYALEVNKKFKEKRKDFNKIVKYMKFKRALYSFKLTKDSITEQLYKLSAELRKQSKIYSSFIDKTKSFLNKQNA